MDKGRTHRIGQIKMLQEQTGKVLSNTPKVGFAVAIALFVPSAGLAFAALDNSEAIRDLPSFAMFTPASADPELAKRVAERSRLKGMRFTPAGSAIKRDRTVTVAVRFDQEAARAVNVRQALEINYGANSELRDQVVTRYDLGATRGYQSFKRSEGATSLSGTVRNIAMPDLAAFEPVDPLENRRPNRFQTRIAIEDRQAAGRSPNTLDALSSQTFDLGGAYSITSNLDVTAGVRLSQERDRLSPITDSVQDSQAVYVGTQFRF